MDYPAQVRKSANLHIYLRWQPWANLHIQDRRERSPVANIHPIFANFFLNTFW